MDVSEILGKIRSKEEVELSEIAHLLSLKDEKDQELLYSEARKVRDQEFGNKTFMYGFVYFSTYCKNNCNFCYYRSTNNLDRYRKSKDEVMELSASLKDAGVNLVDLTMGEDPFLYKDNHKEIIDIIGSIHTDIDIATMLSPGAMPQERFKDFAEVGVDLFACYQETYNRELFSQLRLDQDFEARRNQKVWARQAGILAEDGMLVGLGETAQDRAETLVEMGELGCEQIRAMTFVPQAGTPMEDRVPGDSTYELLAIAVMRILYPDRLIPATLDVEGIAGLKTRLNAGASTITSIIPPNKNLAGVAQHEMDIDDGHRSVEYVMQMLDDMGRRPATNTEFNSWIADRKSKLKGCE